MSTLVYTAEMRRALATRGKLPKELRAQQIVEDAENAAILERCPCGCGILVRHAGIDPRTKCVYETHLIRTPKLAPDIYTCGCQADAHNRQCSHIIAATIKFPLPLIG